MAHKYGNQTAVQRLVAIESDRSISEDLTETALEAADAFIESGLEEEGLPLPTGTYPTTIVQAANFYATAIAIQAVFSEDEDENKKSPFYMSEAEKFLGRYITKIIREEHEDQVNPYKVSKSPVNRHYL